MTRPERVSSIQALAWLNAIVEDDSGNDSEGENVFQGLDQGSANLEKVRPTWKVISSDGSDLETDINDLEQTDSASCQLVSFGSGSNDTSTATQTQGDGLTPITSEIGLVAKDGKTGNTSNFLQK